MPKAPTERAPNCKGPMLRPFLLGLVTAAFLLTAAPAHANRLGLQDDTALKYDTDAMLARANVIGATDVRIMVPDNRWPAERDAIITAAWRAKLAGKHVTAALVAWQSRPTPRQWRRFAQQVVPVMAPVVDAWAPWNEPNHDKFAPRTRPSSIWRVVQKRRARAYCRAWRLVMPVVRLHDPTARRLVGDQAPSTYNFEFMQWFYRACRTARDRPQVLAVHPYCACNPSVRERRTGNWNVASIEDAARFARRHHLRLWVTEWAWGREARREWWPRALRRFERADVDRTYIYDVRDDHWDTKMRPRAVDAVASR